MLKTNRWSLWARVSRSSWQLYHRAHHRFHFLFRSCTFAYVGLRLLILGLFMCLFFTVRVFLFTNTSSSSSSSLSSSSLASSLSKLSSLLLKSNTPVSVFHPSSVPASELTVRSFLHSRMLADEGPSPDIRSPKCRADLATLHSQFVAQLQPSPRVAVIFPSYHDTPYFLLRTIASLFEYTPSELLAAVIVVDDANETPIEDTLNQFYNSSDPTNANNNNQFANREVSHPAISLAQLYYLRLPEHGGLTVAKNTGALVAMQRFKATHLVYIEAHVEVQPGWLEPLLYHMETNKDVVAVPVIDMLVEKQLSDGKQHIVYKPVDVWLGGGFNWDLLFYWTTRRASDSNTDGSSPSIAPPPPPPPPPPAIDDAHPFPYPTGAFSGGLFAVRSSTWVKLGGLDPGLTAWGGENVELSIKAWTCGGRIDIIPCSRMAHYFRPAFPYTFDARSLAANMVRVALVWIEDPRYLDLVWRHYAHARSAIDRCVAAFEALKRGDKQEDDFVIAMMRNSTQPLTSAQLSQLRGQGHDEDSLFVSTVMRGLMDRWRMKQQLQCRDVEWYMNGPHPELKEKAKALITPPPPPAPQQDSPSQQQQAGVARRALSVDSSPSSTSRLEEIWRKRWQSQHERRPDPRG